MVPTVERGLRVVVMPVLDHAARYFVNPVDLIPEMTQGMAGLLDDTYLAFRILENFNYGSPPLMDVDFTVHAEHGSNASSFAARVAASTVSDLHSAVVTGIGVLKGPWHGGAAEAVMKMAIDIGTPDNAEAYARNIIDSGGRIMGFGHRVYKAEDPRAGHMRVRSEVLSRQKGQPQWFQILLHLEQEVMRPYQAKGIYVNVDFYAGSIYYLLGIPDDLFVPIFAVGRIPGWTLQCMEQYENNIIIRPLTEYVGPMDLEYVPIEDRG